MDDLEFMQESTADVLKAICSGMKLGEKHILLSDPVSTEILGSNTVYTIVGNGYIVIDDEVYPIKPDILTVPTSQPVYWVVVQEKFQNEIKKEKKIGIMAGASTPQKSIEEVEKYLNGL